MRSTSALALPPVARSPTRSSSEIERSSAPTEASKLGAGHVDAEGNVFNWRGTAGERPAAIAEPTSLNEAGRLIASADRVRMAGSMHSMANQMMSSGLLMRLDNIEGYSQPERQPDGSYTVWAYGAPTIDQLTAHLEKVALPEKDRGRAPGLTLAWQATQPGITGPGAVANGVHGSGLTPPTPAAEGLATYSDQVVGIKLFKGNGELYDVPKELLPVARVAMGMLPIAALQWRTVPNFEMKSSNKKLEGQAAIDAFKVENLHQDMAQHTSALYTLDLIDGARLNERLVDVVHTDAEAQGLPRKTEYDASSRLASFLAKVAFGASVYAPKALGLLKAFSTFTRRSLLEGPPDRVGTARMMYQHNLNYPVIDQSYSIPIENLHTVVQELAKLFKNEHFDFNLPFSVRLLGNSDKTVLGLNTGRETAILEVTETIEIENANQQLKEEFERVSDEIRNIVRTYGGSPDKPNGQVRVHPAKDIRSPTDLADGFSTGSWQQLAGLIKAIDGKKFLNEWTLSYTPLGRML